MHGTKLQHVKPHGALNNMMPYSEQYSKEICEAILAVDPDIILVAPTNTMTLEMARNMGLRTISEVFADRAYQDDKRRNSDFGKWKRNSNSGRIYMCTQ